MSRHTDSTFSISQYWNPLWIPVDVTASGHQHWDPLCAYWNSVYLHCMSEKIVLSTIQYTLQKGRLGVACNPIQP